MDIAKKIVPYLTAIASLAVGVLVFFLADVEGLLWSLQKEPPVNGEDIVSVDSEHWLGDVSGREAGEGILHLTTGQEWEDLNRVDYVTADPVKIYNTNVYDLAEWADRTRRSRTGTYRGSKPGAKKMPFDYLWGYPPYFGAEYNPYYIVELEDGSRILAMMSRSAAARVRRGESLPLGTKENLGNMQAEPLLREFCKSVGVSTDYYLHALDEDWMESRVGLVFYGKIACGVTAFILVLVIGSVLEKRMKKNNS